MRKIKVLFKSNKEDDNERKKRLELENMRNKAIQLENEFQMTMKEQELGAMPANADLEVRFKLLLNEFIINICKISDNI